MKTTDDRIEAALDAWAAAELSAVLSARTLVRARATLGSGERPAGAAAVVGGFVPAALGLAATVVVADTCLKIQQIFGA
jgi:hypothetical protein